MDNTDKQIKANADKQIKVGGFVEFLKAKKARDGKLNNLGEWPDTPQTKPYEHPTPRKPRPTETSRRRIHTDGKGMRARAHA